LPFLISAVILTGLLSLVDFPSAAKLLADLDGVALTAGVVCYIGSLVLRGIRFQLLMPHFSDRRIGWSGGFDLSVLVAFANHVLPFRLGEAIFIVLARMCHQVPTSRGLLLLVTVRLYDLICLVLVFLVATMVVGLELAPVWYLGTAALAMGLLSMAIRLDWTVRVGRVVFGSAGRVLRVDRTRIGQKLATTLDRAHEGLDILRSPAMIATNIGLSLSVWLCVIGCFHQLLVTFGMPMGFDSVVVGSMGASLTTLLPINAMGNVGTLEAGWAVGFVALGMDRSDAIASGLAMHAIVIATSGILAAWSAARIGAPARNTLWGLKKHDTDD
jgi:glycosyltransferase 2 family protein